MENDTKSNGNTEKTGFSSIAGFLLTAIGCALGIGTFWRFPYLAGTNGGAIFLIVYILIILLIGVPLLTAEITLGYKTQSTAVIAYKSLSKPGSMWHMTGYVHLLAATVLLSYVAPIYIWVLTYVWRTATGFFEGMDPEQISASFDSLNGDYKVLLLFAVLNWVFNWLVVRKNLNAGVEKVSTYMIPALGVIMIVVIIAGLRQPGAMKGVEFLLSPVIEDMSWKSVSEALSQSFYALGLGLLASIVFGSYIKKKKENILKDSCTIGVSIIFAGIMAGLMIFPLVFAFGLEPSSGVGLTMIAMPNVFNHMAGGRIVGTIFYIGFYFAAFTSSIGVNEAIVAVLMDRFGIKRQKAVNISFVIFVSVGLLSILNTTAFNILDKLTSNFLITLGVFFMSVFVGWIWGADNFVEATNVKSPFLKTWLKYSIKYICPVAILIIFISSFIL